MQEYISEAIVLAREPNGDLDNRVALFTKSYGKLVAKAKSSRRITSKLAGHLEPGNHIHARLVERNGLTVADALKISRLPLAPNELHFLHTLIPEGEAEPELWRMIRGGAPDFHRMLRIAGWDPAHASCGICGRSAPHWFRAASQEFFCDTCASQAPQSEVFYLHR